jgi:hypothetical protein
MGATANSTVKETVKETVNDSKWKCTHCQTWTEGMCCHACGIRG